MTASSLITHCEYLDVRLSVEGDCLVCDAPVRVVDATLRADLVAHKSEIITLLSGRSLPQQPGLTPMSNAARRFPLLPQGPLGPWTPRRTEEVTITPEVAAFLLENHNKHNRHLSSAHYKAIASAIMLGHWVCTGVPIIFDATGNLVDGQHRLMACVSAEIPITVTVVFGASEDVATVIDQRKKPRSFSDTLYIEGHAHNSTVASVLNVVMSWEKLGFRTVSVVQMHPFSIQEKQEYLRERPSIHDSAREAANSPMVKFVPKRTLGATHYLFGQKDAGARDRFFEKFDTGADLHAGDPILVLRQRLVSNVPMSGTDGAKRNMGMNQTFISMKLIVHAWNHVRSGTTSIANLLIKNKEGRGGRLVPTDIPEIL